MKDDVFSSWFQADDIGGAAPMPRPPFSQLSTAPNAGNQRLALNCAYDRRLFRPSTINSQHSTAKRHNPTFSDALARNQPLAPLSFPIPHFALRIPRSEMREINHLRRFLAIGRARSPSEPSASVLRSLRFGGVRWHLLCEFFPNSLYGNTREYPGLSGKRPVFVPLIPT